MGERMLSPTNVEVIEEDDLVHIGINLGVECNILQNCEHRIRRNLKR